MSNFNSHGQELDGKGNIQPAPYDVHERVVRKAHTHSKEHGYQPVEEPEAPAAEAEEPETDGQ